MKVKNGKPFIVKTSRCIATVTVENFSPKIVEEFNRVLAEEIVRRTEEVA